MGLCSITCAPQDGAVDIGYGIAPSRQRRGIATRAIGAIVDWARAAPHVTAITAETLPGNRASQRVLEANGFVCVRERLDVEDGRLLCWRRAVS